MLAVSLYFGNFFLTLALLPCDIKSFFEPVFEQAKLLEKAYISTDKDRNTKIKLPFITVWEDLDHILLFSKRFSVS